MCGYWRYYWRVHVEGYSEWHFISARWCLLLDPRRLRALWMSPSHVALELDIAGAIKSIAGKSNARCCMQIALKLVAYRIRFWRLQFGVERERCYGWLPLAHQTIQLHRHLHFLLAVCARSNSRLQRTHPMPVDITLHIMEVSTVRRWARFIFHEDDVRWNNALCKAAVDPQPPQTKHLASYYKAGLITRSSLVLPGFLRIPLPAFAFVN